MNLDHGLAIRHSIVMALEDKIPRQASNHFVFPSATRQRAIAQVVGILAEPVEAGTKSGTVPRNERGGSCDYPVKCLKRMAPQVGLEPTTLRLTAGCSAIELLRNLVVAPGGALQLRPS